MAYEIRELRHDELEEAVQFAREQGSALQASQVRPRSSVLARDEQDAVVGGAFCFGPRYQLALEVVVSQQADPALTRQLVDKALLKLRSENVRRCVIRTTAEVSDEPLWAAVRWSSAAPTPAAAAC